MNNLHGWTTADPTSVAIWEHLPSGIRCRLILEDADGQRVTPDAWTPVEEYLPDDAGHSLAHMLLTAGTGEVDVEFAGEGDVAACRICDVHGDNLSAHWEIDTGQEGWQVQMKEQDVTLAPEGAVLPADVTAFLHAQHAVKERTALHGEGLLADPLAALDATLAANTFLLPPANEPVTLSRHLLESTGAWRLPNWQTFLTALGIAYADPLLAVANCRTALRHLAVGSLLGAEATAAGVNGDISNPPVAAYCIWKIYQLTLEHSLLADAYPQLLRWHDWWLNARDGHHDHFLNWASDAEAGMPGHPLYANVPRDPSVGLLRLDDVGLCSLWALDAFSLMRMALALDDLDRATHLEEEIRTIADHVNAALWNPARGSYECRDWDGHFVTSQSATILLAIAGGIPSRTRLERLVGEHLPYEFNTQFLLPTVGSGDAAFSEQLPWRGRVSSLLNFLICEGLRHFGEDVWAERIVLSGLDLLARSWREHRQVFASYHAVSGLGDDIAQDPLAPAGLLFGALGVGMLADVEPWDGLRLGNLCGAEMAVHGLPLHGRHYDVSSTPQGLTVQRDGKAWLETDRPVILRNLLQTDHEITLQAKVAGGGQFRLRVHDLPPKQHVAIRVNGKAAIVIVDAHGIAERIVDLPSAGGQGGSGLARAA